MSEYHSLLVILDDDTRSDDAQPLMDAIRCLRGVKHVSGNVAEVETYIYETRAYLRMWDVLANALKELKP